jgi:hypothetical protein
MSKRQGVVALSTTETEYMVATHGSKEVLWLQRLCSSIGFVQKELTIGCDSSSAIFLTKNLYRPNFVACLETYRPTLKNLCESEIVGTLPAPTHDWHTCHKWDLNLGGEDNDSSS